jgi:NAD(P)-dependent dehydrogenase (short-subunit alcohol dehydrogenase family)
MRWRCSGCVFHQQCCFQPPDLVSGYLWRETTYASLSTIARITLPHCARPFARIREGTPNEIAKAVVFLATDDSSYIAGTELFVDGGFALGR